MYPEIIEYPNNLPVKASLLNISRYPFHLHDAVEIVHILKGSVLANLSTEEHLLKEHALAVVNANEMHRFVEGDKDNLVLIIHLDRAWCERVLPDFAFSFFWCCSTYQTANQRGKYLRMIELERNLAESLLRESNKAIEDAARELLAYMAANFNFISLGPGLASLSAKQAARIKRMYKYVVDHAYKVSLQELTSEFNMHICHMSHMLREKFGRTFQELLDYSKGSHAAKLLLGTDRRIIDISNDSGFSDSKYLIKYFKTHYHCTPTQFRKLYRIDPANEETLPKFQEYPLDSSYIDQIAAAE